MKKVIVVEDSSLMRHVLAGWLEPVCRVEATDSAHRAMALLDGRSDWLVISTLLARNSGLELLYEVNAWPDLRSVRSVLLTHDPHYWREYRVTLKELSVTKVLSVSGLGRASLRKALELG